MKRKILIITLLLIQMIQAFIGLKSVNAQINENDEITLLRRS